MLSKRDKKKFRKTIKFLSDKEHEFYRDYLANKNWNPLRVFMFLEKLETVPWEKRNDYLQQQGLI